MHRSRRPSTAPAPSRTRALVACLALAVLALSLPQPASAAAALPQGVSPAGDYLCRIDADCQPCPPQELDSPVCKLWGNRRPLSCIPRLAAPARHNLADADPPQSSSSSSSSPRPDSARHPASTPPAPAVDAHDKPLSPAEQELRDVIDAGRRRQRRSPPLDGPGVVLVAHDSPEWALAARLARRAGPGGGEDGGDEALEGTTRGVQDVLHTWEACPKVLRQEYNDYFEFIMCNVAFAVVGGLLLMYRQRTLALRQFGRLAARIMQTEIS
ncbi:uncharacterized protein RHOBADRAFT_47482 [Rhodotorula graminis WP1]|uniref:Copper transporter n=1 Tax=Rhodotorula graminis (strain WP1) TaxID=578459 RepID=A0A0P9EJE2_RHOGW|nr:uncharacterized protein RHOBADRAFT_47482 [Rhodotorula graminis WP1]KPV71778.1 hypothetical protein RHOBADRAFT_47482 [Rhodotorula graminis WP1]